MRVSFYEKLWILNHHKENPKITRNKIALDFSAKLEKTVSRHCVLRVIQNNDQHEALVKADLETISIVNIDQMLIKVSCSFGHMSTHK